MVRIMDNGTLDYFLVETYISEADEFERDFLDISERITLDEINKI